MTEHLKLIVQPKIRWQNGNQQKINRGILINLIETGIQSYIFDSVTTSFFVWLFYLFFFKFQIGCVGLIGSVHCCFWNICSQFHINRFIEMFLVENCICIGFSHNFYNECELKAFWAISIERMRWRNERIFIGYHGLLLLICLSFQPIKYSNRND